MALLLPRLLWLLPVFLLLLAWVPPPTSEAEFSLCSSGVRGGQYRTDAGPVPGILNVHLVPHTHDDVGWLKTVDQYFVGSNNSIQVAAVQYILDSVTSSLQEDANRKFVYVEQAFFQRWWRVQTKSKQRAVKKLVQSGQLEFINGAWAMHDEASTHYVDMIDQTTLGHRFIKKQFNKVPRVGWQIDPFGHSAVQAYLLGAEIGFDAVFFARADYQDVAKRREDRTMEFIWRGSKSLGESAQIFGGILSHHYDPPTGFRYDIDSKDSPIQDDPLLYDYNVPEIVDLFVKSVQEQADQFRTEHVMWTMGEDFAYENANTWFKQMDKLIHYVNQDGRVNAFYSTPSLYVDAKHEANETWPLKIGDFFPYGDSAFSYWTGYFTSRPGLKGYVRRLSGYLHAARQLEFLLGRAVSGPNTDSLEEALAILQHHDGVSGTEKQHVANDYAKRLAIGAAEAEEVMNKALSSLLIGNSVRMPLSELTFIRQGVEGSQTSMFTELKLEQCGLLNLSFCPPSETDFTNGRSLVVVAYNSLGWARKEWIRLPVTSELLEVLDETGTGVPSQLVPVNKHMVSRLRKFYVNAYSGISTSKDILYTLVFQASVPPLGYRSYFVRPSSVGGPACAQVSIVESAPSAGHVSLNSGNLHLNFSHSRGQLASISHAKTGISVSLHQTYCWYNGSAGNTEDHNHQASGAYIFRPNSSACYPVGNGTLMSTRIVRGELVEEVHQRFSSWISQVVRLYKNAEFAEVEFSVGPIPIDDNFGKEVVTKFQTDIASQGEFFTDSNGRDFIRRVRNHRDDWDWNVTEPEAGNYYPLNLGMYIQDGLSDFSVLVDRAVGGSSLSDGQLELMLHRRLLYDDGKGVGEPLNETICIQERVCEGLTVNGVVLLGINPVKRAARWRRSHGQRLLAPLQLAFSVLEEGVEISLGALSFSAAQAAYELPPNVALMTLQELEGGEILLRLAHLFEVGEDEELAEVASVPLQSLFPIPIKDVIELSLSGNQVKSEMRTLQWQTDDDTHVVENRIIRGEGIHGESFTVELGPMEIKTFNVALR